jgi:hypothetical protein
MILETDEERKAFKFICEYAGEHMGNAGCNDLNETEKWAEKLQVERDGTYLDKVRYDFDIINWLESRIK